MTMEIWKPVVGYEGLYDISNLGRIKSFLLKKERISNGHVGSWGYFQLHLRKKDTPLKGVRIHRLVAEAFHGPCPEGLQCAHMDGDQKNNRADNLKWVTPKENQSHRVKHGTLQFGEDHPNAKLTNKIVLAIKADFEQGMRQYKIAKKYQVDFRLVSDILNGKVWARII